MPVSSTFSTSAPKSASSSEQKPPGSRRERSKTFTPERGRLIAPSKAWLGGLAGPSGDPEQPARLGDRGGAPAHVFGHLACLGDQVAVGAGHLAAWQVQVVLDAR